MKEGWEYKKLGTKVPVLEGGSQDPKDYVLKDTNGL